MSRATDLVRQAFTSLRRNALVVAAAILAVFVSLSLAFGALVVNELFQVNTTRWQEGVHVVVFMKDDVSQAAQLDLHVPMSVANPFLCPYRPLNLGIWLFSL